MNMPGALLTADHCGGTAMSDPCPQCHFNASGRFNARAAGGQTDVLIERHCPYPSHAGL